MYMQNSVVNRIISVVLHERKTKFNWVNLQKERLRQKQLMGTTGCLEIICSSVEVFKSMAK